MVLAFTTNYGLYEASSSRRFQGEVAAERMASRAILDRARVSDVGGSNAQEIDVFSSRSKEPAPMGIADYGVGQDGAYEYATNSSVGIVRITSLSTSGSRRTASMTFQLNVNLLFTSDNGQQVFWIQDVASLDTSSRIVTFLDNVWNVSSPTASISASALTGNGSVAPTRLGNYYYCIASESLPGNNVSLTYPVTITFNVTSGVNPSGQPTVSLAYDDGHGLITYDLVTFTAAGTLTSLTGFEVNGFNYNPAGIFYDAELIMGGPGGGSQTTDVQSDIQLELEYWNGHNYQDALNAYNFGSDTAETISNVLARPSHDPDSGTMLAQIQPGAGTLGNLYNQSQIGIIDITSPLSSGILYVTNASNSTATARQYPFIDGQVTVTVYPGTYSLQLYQNGEIYDQRDFTVNSGQNLSLQTPFTTSPHNIAVVSVQTAKTVIGEGFTDNITVNVANKGENTETFNVTAYANATIVGIQQISNLNATSHITLTFIWNTTGLPKGNYTISAYATPVPSENDTADNTLEDGRVSLAILGDVDASGKVDIIDIANIAKLFDTNFHDTRYNPNCDINSDGKIDIVDLAIAARNFGKIDA
jgi:hypothetical protein